MPPGVVSATNLARVLPFLSPVGVVIIGAVTFPHYTCQA